MHQKTIKVPVMCQGISLHLGIMAKIKFLPANTNSGIYFIHNGEKITVDAENVSNTSRGTSLKNISTVEHLLAAVYSLGIDNLEIQIEGNEIPALDGAALSFIKILESAGITEQGAQKEYIIIKKPLSIKEAASEISIEPASHLIIEAEIDYPNSIVGFQHASFDEEKDYFENEIAPCRTFGFMSEVKELWKNNLAKGASFDNAIAILDNGYSSPLKFPNELARHKILDIMGDIALAGKRIKGKIISKKGSHRLNIELVKAIKENENA